MWVIWRAGLCNQMWPCVQTMRARIVVRLAIRPVQPSVTMCEKGKGKEACQPCSGQKHSHKASFKCRLGVGARGKPRVARSRKDCIIAGDRMVLKGTRLPLPSSPPCALPAVLLAPPLPTCRVQPLQQLVLACRGAAAKRQRVHGVGHVHPHMVKAVALGPRHKMQRAWNLLDKRKACVWESASRGASGGWARSYGSSNMP